MKNKLLAFIRVCFSDACRGAYFFYCVGKISAHAFYTKLDRRRKFCISFCTKNYIQNVVQIVNDQAYYLTLWRPCDDTLIYVRRGNAAYICDSIWK